MMVLTQSMKRNKSIQLKAVFLLMAFSLNSIVGFACAAGLDMGFNSNHHEESGMEVSENHHHEANTNCHQTNSQKDNCCNNGVVKFQQIDKNIEAAFSLIGPSFFTSFPASFYNIDILSSGNKSSGINYLVRKHRPPIPDIWIAIQSFQI